MSHGAWPGCSRQCPCLLPLVFRDVIASGRLVSATCKCTPKRPLASVLPVEVDRVQMPNSHCHKYSNPSFGSNKVQSSSHMPAPAARFAATESRSVLRAWGVPTCSPFVPRQVSTIARWRERAESTQCHKRDQHGASTPGTTAIEQPHPPATPQLPPPHLKSKCTGVGTRKPSPTAASQTCTTTPHGARTHLSDT